ncbi:hypothetical protein D3C79_802270 [compost metagenome]
MWGVVASGIRLWTEDEELEEITIQESALRLLEESPDPTVVLEAFAERVWSGSRTNVMQPRADAIRKLVEHERADIAAAAKTVSANLVQLIDRQKEREQREDMEHEQRFE